MDPNKDNLTFQQLDIDHYNGEPVPGMPGSQVTNNIQHKNLKKNKYA